MGFHDYCNSRANKSNHPIQNPSLLDTGPRTRDSILRLSRTNGRITVK
jgi:hypothetical protein